MTGMVIIEGFFALFAAIGAATIVWLIIGVFIKPRSCEGVHTYTVVTADGAGANAVRAVSSLLWWQDMVPEDREIILCGGFDWKTRESVAALDSRGVKITVLGPKDLGGYLEMQLSDNSAGDIDGTGENKAGGNRGYGDIPQ